MEVLTDRPAERFARGANLFREGSARPYRIVEAVAIQDGPGWRLRLDGIADRAAAEGLRGAYLEVELAPAEVPARGSYYWHEVVGCPVVGLDGEALGSVADVYRVAENDVYVVRGGARGEFDVPALREFIRVFAPRRGEIVVDAAALDLGPAQPPRRSRPPRPRGAQRSGPPASDPATAADPPAGQTGTGTGPDATPVASEPADDPGGGRP